MNYRLFAQRDPQWSRSPLGRSNSTMGNYGCVVCSITSMLSAFQVSPTPPAVNDRFIKMHQFAGPNLNIDQTYYEGASGGRLAHVHESPDFARPVPADYLDQLKRHLQQGQPAMVLVDIEPGRAQPGVQTHFMLATMVSPDGSDVIVNDSWAAVTAPLCQIGNGAYLPPGNRTLAGALYRFNLFYIGSGW